MKIIMLPYAGCIGRPYKNWSDEYGSDMILINYFGNKDRMENYNVVTWDQLIGKIYNDIKKYIIDKEEYIIFGHSMGAIAAYDLYQKIVIENFNRPKKIIFSGSPSPQYIKNKDTALSEKELKEKYIKMGGINEVLINNKEFMDIFFEMLYRDLKLLEGYVFNNNSNSKIDCDVLVMNGSEDEKSSLEDWKDICKKRCDYMIFQGRHFFIFNNPKVFSFLKTVF